MAVDDSRQLPASTLFSLPSPSPSSLARWRRQLKWAAGPWLLVLAVVAGLELISLPEAVAQPAQPVAVEVLEDYIYGRKDGMALTFDVVTPSDPNGYGLCFMVSGGWNSMWFPPRQWIKDSLYQSLLDSGYTIFLVRHGSAPRYKVPEAVADVRLAIEKIRANAEQFGVDPDKLGAFGGSAGGHLSVILGTTGEPQQRVAAVAAYYPPTNLHGYVDDPEFVKNFPALDFERELVDSVSPELHVTSDDAPTLLIHGDQDTLVPLHHSEKLKVAMDDQKVSCRLLVIQNAGHAFQGDDKKKAEQAVVQWFDQHLRGLQP